MKKRFTKLLFLVLCTGSLCAQSPGGVSAPELWFQTKPVTSDRNGAYRWVDYSGDSLRLNVYDSQGASFGSEFTNTTVCYYNGHAALSLTKLLDANSKNVKLKRTNLSQATLVGVFAPNANFDKEMLLYGLNGRPRQGVLVTNNKVIPSIESGKQKFDYGETEGMDLMYSSNDQEADINTFRERSMRIAAYYRSVPPSSGIWGERDQAILTFGSNYSFSNVNYNSTFSVPIAENRAFSGYIPEFIAYNRLITPIERSQVDSYLAIKYGLSLPVSYIGSNGQLLWDYDTAPGYNNRITAIYRDNNSGLYQAESATSYEEQPNYSDQSLYDFYYNSNPNNRTSSSKLLVIGRQYGNELKDNSYLFWGDDDHSIKLKSIEGMLGMKIMSRQWLVKTNMEATSSADRVMEWQVLDLNLTTKGFISTIVKPSSSSSPAQGTAFTATPLADRNGYLGVSNITLFGDIYLKFGNNQTLLSSGSHDYGYYISSNRVYTIIQGVKSATPITTLILTSRLEMEKDGDLVYLRSDGVRLADSEILIADGDKNKQFYGAVCLTKGTFDSQVDIRHGGFVDTGNRVELSYATNKASEFKDNNKGRSLLLIDRSGSGNVDPATAETIEADEIDVLRQKAIFNNVFFQSGDVFTFAYRESDLAGEIEIIDPECNQANGEVTITIKQGTRAFDYTLTDTATGEVVKTGKEYGYTILLDGLKGGEYELKITESGGFNFENINPNVTPNRAKTTNFFPVFEGNMEWSVSNVTDKYMIGWTTIAEDVNSSKNIIHYGLKKDGNTLYKVVSGKLESTGVTVQEGDVLKITKNMSKVTYFKNGVQFSSNSIKWYDYLLKFYGLIDMSEGKAELLNVKAEGFFNLADYNWTKTNNMEIKYSDGASLSYQFVLNDPCGANVPPIAPPTEQAKAKNDNMEVLYKADMRSVTARVIMEEPDVVTFAAYSLSGALVKKVNLTTPRKIQETDLDFGVSGVYIIKAITTSNGEFSKKVLIK